MLAYGSALGPASAGYCAGDKERVKKTFERMSFSFDQTIGLIQVRFVHPVRIQARFVVARMALWSLYVQSRQIVLESLLAGELGREQMDAIGRLWARADEVRQSIGRPVSGKPRPAQGGPAVIMENVVGSWAVCRAVRDQHSQACQMLDALNPDLAESCRAPSANIGDFVRHCRSSGFLALRTLIAELRHRCEAKGPDAGPLCAGVLAYDGEELAGCRAIENDDISACRGPGLTAYQRLECESILAAFRYLSGRIDERAFRKGYRGGHIDAIAAVGPDGRDCLWVALDRYDRFAVPFFYLVPTGLGALPSM